MLLGVTGWVIDSDTVLSPDSHRECAIAAVYANVLTVLVKMQVELDTKLMS